MKKNAMLKIAAILMVAVLLTTCAISSTFAKYVASGSDSTEARVAKWGVKVESDIFAGDAALFAESYSSANGDVLAAQEEKDGVTFRDLVVAPGTENTISVKSVVEGTPEVSGKVVVTAKFTIGDGWEALNAEGTGKDFYCPLVITAGGQSVTFDSSTKEITKSQEFTFKAGEDLDDKVDYDVHWEWAFSKDAETDRKDTYLADNGEPTITVELTIAIEQTGAAVVVTP